MSEIQNHPGPTLRFFRFGQWYFVLSNLSFDFAQDGEPVEPF
jgi:hypothetical protein